ncbi:MAG: CvpA family protein [Legionellales bacterium]|nr:CvpA family protein [Legionellales bacterium]
MAWHWIDYIIIAVIALSVLTGLFRGFIKELIALCIWILAIWLAMTYSTTVDFWLQSYIQDKTVRVIVSFVSILLATILVGGLFNALLSFILRRSGLSGTDRLLGMGFGFVRGVFIVALLMLVINMTTLADKKYTSQSVLYSRFEPLVNWLGGYMPLLIKHLGTFDTKSTPVKLDTKDIKPGP